MFVGEFREWHVMLGIPISISEFASRGKCSQSEYETEWNAM